MANFLTDSGTQNVVSKGREAYFGNYAVTGGTIYVAVLRSSDGVVSGIAQTLVPSFTAGASTGADSITTISTVGAGTLTAAGLAGGIITRSGSIAAYSDTTDTAAALLVALPTFVQNSSKRILIRNTVNFPQTILGGTNVTIAGQIIVPADSVGTFLLVRTDANTATPTFSLTGVDMTQLTVTPYMAATALTTNGAGTITAAGIVGQFTVRTGISSGTAFNDTVDTAANIIAALPDAVIGQSLLYTYVNNTNAVATILTAASVTLSGPVIIPPGQSAEFLVTVTAATTVSIVGLGAFPNASKPPIIATAFAAASGTAAAGVFTGANFIVLTASTQTVATTLTTRTATQLVADHPNTFVGDTWTVRIVNTNFLANAMSVSGTAVGAPLTVTGGTGVNGAATFAIVPQGTYVDVLFTVTAAATITTVIIGGGPIAGQGYNQWTLDTTAGVETLGQFEMTGAPYVFIKLSGGSSYTVTPRTGLQLFADTPGAYIGMSWVVEFQNNNSNTVLLAVATSVTITGTLTMSTSTTRKFLCQFTTVSNVAMTCISSGAFT